MRPESCAASCRPARPPAPARGTAGGALSAAASARVLSSHGRAAAASCGGPAVAASCGESSGLPKARPGQVRACGGVVPPPRSSRSDRPRPGRGRTLTSAGRTSTHQGGAAACQESGGDAALFQPKPKQPHPCGSTTASGAKKTKQPPSWRPGQPRPREEKPDNPSEGQCNRGPREEPTTTAQRQMQTRPARRQAAQPPGQPRSSRSADHDSSTAWNRLEVAFGILHPVRSLIFHKLLCRYLVPP